MPDDEGEPATDTRSSGIEPDDGVDVSLIRWMLSLSPSERLDVLQGFVDSVSELVLNDESAARPSLERPPED
jgi:hypothetical protein